MNEWPPRWTGPQFKGPKVTTKQLRARKHAKVAVTERSQKELVRDRDQGCRFPLCGCLAKGLWAEVSHAQHKGMGGNPTGDRSTTPLMITLCAPRHKENRVSIDRGTLRWVPLTPKGADGLVAWEVKGAGGWVEVAREKQIGEWEPFTNDQQRTLDRLAEMKR